MKKFILTILLTGTVFLLNSSISSAEEHPGYNSQPTKDNNASILHYKIKYTLNEEHPNY